MTPKEKAQELVCKMYGCELNTDLNDIYILNGDGYFLAKDNALTCINEILGEIYSKNVIISDARRNFWQQVKTEINKL